MANSDEIQEITNVITQKELIRNIKQLNTIMSNAPASFKKISSEVSEANTYLKSMANGTSYQSLEESGKIDEIKKIFKVLSDTNKAVRKEEKKSNNDAKTISFLSSAHKATVDSAGAIKAWAKSSSPTINPRLSLGNKEDNAEANRQSGKTYNMAKNTASVVQKYGKSIAKSYSPTVNKQLATKFKTPSWKGGSGNTGNDKTKTLLNIIGSTADGMSSLNNSIGNFAGALGSAYSTMMDAMGNFLDNPFESMIGVMSGMSRMISASFSTISNILDTAVNFLSSIFEATSGAGKKDGSGVSSAIGGVVSSLVGVISSIVSMAVQAIEAGFNIFASTLTSIMKIVKKIALSSPIMRAILDLLNLAFTLFFMPFMNSFGLVLLPYVLGILNWAVTTGETFSTLGKTLGDSFAGMFTADEGILEQVSTLATSFIEDFLPDILELLPDLIDFALDFVSEILDNAPDIIDFMKFGFEAFSAMLDAGILPTFLDFGKKVMEWVGKNASDIVVFVMAMMNGLLAIATFFAKFTGGGGGAISSEVSEKIEASTLTLAQEMEKTTQGTNDSITELTNSTNPVLAGSNSLNGGIPVVSSADNTGEYSLSEAELKEVGKDTTVTVQYNGDVLSKNEFKSEVRTVVSDVSNKSYFR